ncbi:MAG: dihydropteroate synthase [Rhodobacteraceae bacterium]|nr:dihydropteroate synthase [Paracoccaceae bacterium]
MGILNVTPDSFSDGGSYKTDEEIVARAIQMSQEGAAIVDVGAESTRPGATPVSQEDELRRLAPVLGSICEDVPVAVSIDTYKSTVARVAAEQGAAVINDIWGLQRDPEMASVVAGTGSAVIAMHNRETIDPELDIIEDILRFFELSLQIARKAGIPDHHVILDPGMGFGKTFEQNYAILAKLGRLAEFGRPILLGLSRKRMIGRALTNETDSRLIGTISANALGLANGARILRVHDVSEHADALRIFCAMENAQ